MTHAARRARVLEAAPVLLVTHQTNVRYLTGFTGSNAQLLLCGEPVLFTDGRYIEQSAQQAPDLSRVVYTQGAALAETLGPALADRGIKSCAFEAAHATVDAHARLESALHGVDLVATTGLVEEVRARKERGEIESIRRAQRIAERALTSSIDGWTAGTERDLALAIEWAIRTGGADDVSFETIVASGAHSALPHARPRHEAVPGGAPLLCDLGARVDGYCSDMTRTFLRGSGGVLAKAYATVVRAVAAACASVRPGAACRDVDGAARAVVAADGFGDAFTHGTGHGVGLDIHESPRVGPASEDVLEAGMVVTIEPGVYLPGVGGVRVEDLLVVTEDGYENLTALPR